MKILLLGDENFTFISGFLHTHPEDDVEVACCLAEDQLKDETKATIDNLKERGIPIHFRVNPAQMKSTFAEDAFDKMVYILPGIAFHGTPDFIDTKSEMFKLRLHFFCFGFLKSVKPFIKLNGEVLFLWPDLNDESVPFSHIEIDKLARFCYVQRAKESDTAFEHEYYEEDWKPMVHNITKTTIPDWMHNAKYYCFRMDDESKTESSKPTKKKRKYPGEDKKDGGDDTPNDSNFLDDEDNSKSDDFNILRIPPQIFSFDRNQFPHVNESFHFKLWGKNSQSFQVSKLSLKYDPRISGWKGDGSPNKPNKEAMYRSNRPMRGMKNDMPRSGSQFNYNVPPHYPPHHIPNPYAPQGPGGPPPPPPNLGGSGGAMGNSQHPQHHLLPSHQHNAPGHPHHYTQTPNAAPYPAHHPMNPPKPGFGPNLNPPPSRGYPPHHQGGHASSGPAQQQQALPTHLRHNQPHDPNYRNPSMGGAGGPHYPPPHQVPNQQPQHNQQQPGHLIAGGVTNSPNRPPNYPNLTGSPQANQPSIHNTPIGSSTPRSTSVNQPGSTLGSARTIQIKKSGSSEPGSSGVSSNTKRLKNTPGTSNSTAEYIPEESFTSRGPATNYNPEPHPYNPDYSYLGGYNDPYIDPGYTTPGYDHYRGHHTNYDGYNDRYMGYDSHPPPDYSNPPAGNYDTSQYPPMDHSAPPNDYYNYTQTNQQQGYNMMNNMGYYDSTSNYSPPAGDPRANYNYDYSNTGYNYREDYNTIPPAQGYTGDDYGYDNLRGYGHTQAAYDSSYYADGTGHTPPVNNYPPKTQSSSTEKVSSSSVGNSHPSNNSYNQYGRY